MKIKDILFASFTASVLMIGNTSCSDSFLGEKMYSSYGTDVADVNAKILGIHYKVGCILGYSSNQGYPGIWQVGTDVGAPGDTQGVENPFYRYAELNSENAGVSYLWTMLYDIINCSNQIITAEEENGDKALVAEAKFFRAWAYNQLVTGWGDVPLVIESATTPRTDYVREAVTEIDKVIEEDLVYAVENLPEVTALAKESRISKDAARQLAGETYLRIGMRDNSYFKKAEDVLTPIIEGGQYKLISGRYGKYTGDPGDYYHDMFRWGNQRRSEGNTEGIWTFEMEYNASVSGGTIDNPQQRRNWVPAFHKLDGMVNADSIGGRGNGRLRLSNYVKYGLFEEEGDIRNSNFNIRRVMWYNKPDFSMEIGLDADGWQVEKDKGVRNITIKTGDQVIPHKGDTLNVFYPHTTKWGGYDVTDDFGYALVKDFPMMRFAETYLLRAEARFRQGNTQGAADDINVLRDRAFQEYRQNNPSAGKVTADMIDINFILDERIRELVGEENRRFTLMRTGELDNRVSMMLNGWNELDNSKKLSGFDANKHTLLPIPLTEIQLNKDAVLEQNPGY
ncbi:RagB/SusD family nutrient uptake outer membrane protein [Parabacteroides sp. AF48-14]|uniref:RagB/SusD family nutrient uptake outer membrane protein n=1 Tax=Parabacteroides sp. AF48-14 TaxID=2292052 RepID=UPI000EFDE52F|nr:RagB/SusD family nutrient uptake outer membrane protein [Parabacteroides sp. AF48-14]RHO67440.1 RagB/SusD family nutrient uptake outer membrane protein [Parabacteroides sp. AF48-14]